MNTPPLPVRYRLDIYESSFVSDPIIFFESSSPFMAFHKGDHLDPGMWAALLKLAPPPIWYQVQDVVHSIWKIERSHVSHRVGVCIAPIGLLP